MFEISNLTKTKIDKKFLEKTAQKAVEILSRKDLENISLVLVGDVKIRKINRECCGRNCVTDVLSFEGLGEIFICLPQAIRQAKLLKTPLKTELTRLLVHGIVHLKGFEHERSKKMAEAMFKVEDKILKSL